MANRADNFNRTESPLATPSDGGANWNDLTGTSGAGFDAGSGQTVAYNVGGGEIVCVLDCAAADHATQAKIIRNDGAWGLANRAADNSNYYLGHCPSGSACLIYKKVAGSYTLLATGSATAVTNDTISFDVTGTSLDLKINTVSKASVTDSSLSGDTHAGLRSGSGAGYMFWDDFSITVGGGGGATPKGVLGKPLYGPMRRVVF